MNVLIDMIAILSLLFSIIFLGVVIAAITEILFDIITYLINKIKEYKGR